MSALGATASENATTALRAAANQEAVRTGTLDLGRLIGTFGSHDFSSIGMNFSGITDMPSEVKTQEMGTAGGRHAQRTRCWARRRKKSSHPRKSSAYQAVSA